MMGLFDSIAKNKEHKERDKLIEKVKKYLADAQYESASFILASVFTLYSKHDPEYRSDEIHELIEICDTAEKETAAKRESKKQKEQNAFPDKASIVEAIKTALDKKDWRKAIGLLDEAEKRFLHKHRDIELEELSVKAQEMCLKSDEINGLDDVPYSQIYLNMKDYYIDMVRDCVKNDNLKVARNILRVLDEKYSSSYRENEVKELWKAVIDKEAQKTNEFEVPKREDTLQDLQKLEALNRLDVLAKEGKMDGKPYMLFKNNILCGSLMDDEGVPYIKKLDENDDLYLLAKSYEEELGCMVYHAVDAGRTAYLLTVHKDPDSWANERLDGDKIAALIFSLDEDDYYYDYVHIFNNNGALGVEQTEEYSFYSVRTEEESYTEEDEEEEREYILNVTTDQQLDEEIKKRLRTLSKRIGLDEMAYTHWCEGRICCSRTDEKGNVSIFPVEEGSEYASMIEKLEKTAKCMAYHLVDMGKEIYLLNILFSSGLKYGRLWKDSDTVSMLWCSKDNLEDIWYLDLDVKTSNGALVVIEEDAEEQNEETSEEAEETTAEHFEETAEETAEEISVETTEPQEQLIDGLNAEQWFYKAMQYMNGDGVGKNLTKSLEYMENAAKLGSSVAMHNCCIMYIQGQGTAVDEEKSYYWLEQAAEHGYNQAMYNLGWQYLNGAGRKKNDDKGLEWLTKAAEAGYGNACFELGRLSEKGSSNVVQDDAKALYWYEKAAKLGNDEAMVKCFVAYVDGVGCDKDVDKGVYWLQEAAKRENADAMARLGIALLREAKNQDDVKQILTTYLIPAAKKGDADALQLCAEAFRLGTGLDKDEKKALELYTLAAEKGSEFARKFLVNLYTEGGIAEPDSEKALYWKEKLAENDAELAVEISKLYSDMGGQENFEKALQWLKKAADLGDVTSMNTMVYICEKNGYKNEAFQYSLKSAQHGDAVEMYNTSLRYLKGEGCEKDVEQAAYWREKSAENGYLLAQFSCAVWYFDSEHTQPDFDMTFYWMQKVLERIEEAEDDLKSSIYYVAGMLYVTPAFAEYDGQKAYEMFEKAAQFGSKQAYSKLVYNGIRNLAGDKQTAFYWAKKAAQLDSTELLMIGAEEFYAKDNDVVNDKAEALRWYEAAAEYGNAFAMYAAGVEYMDDGSGNSYVDDKKSLYWLNKAYEHSDALEDEVKAHVFSLLGEHNRLSDTEKAYEFYQMAAELGDMNAIGECCMLCLNGWVAESSNSKALYWAKRAAQLGNTSILTGTAELFYEEDNDFPNDKAEALRWYEAAAEYDDRQAILQAAEMYRKGIGCAPDVVKSHHLIEELAKRGDSYAMCLTAQDYSQGEGVEKNMEKSFEWYLKAAQAEQPVAMYQTGLCCMIGIGTEVSLEKAKSWFKKAEATGDKTVLDAISRLKEKFDILTW